MQLMADHLIVIGQGRVLADDTVEGFLARNVASDVLVRVPDPARLMTALTNAGLTAILLQVTRSETVASLMPFLNASAAVSAQVGTADAYQHVAVFAAWALLCLAAAVLVVGRRDV
jgi:hypothetical protein